MLRNRPESPTRIGLYLVFNPYRNELHFSVFSVVLELLLDRCVIE